MSSEATNGDAAIGPPEILVAADQALIGEAVRAALMDRGYTVVAVPWRGRRRLALPLPRRGRPRAPRVGLLVSALDRWSLLYEAQAVMAGLEVPWLVLTDVPPGPALGGLLVGGADLVLPANTGLDAVCAQLEEIAGSRAAMPPEEWATAVADWLDSAAEQEANAARIARLSSAQRRVLEMLHLGIPVVEIAQRLGVAPSTVRSQVKEVMRRLEVGTQLAAVAAYEHDREGPGRPRSQGVAVPGSRPPNA